MEITDFKTSTNVQNVHLQQKDLTFCREPRLIVYNNLPIVYIDFSNLKKPEEIYAMMDRTSAFIRKHHAKSLYTLTNLTGMHFNNEIFSRMSSYVKSNNPYVKSSAVVGMGGLMQIFYNSFTKLTGRDVKAFATEIEAKEFLAKQ